MTVNELLKSNKVQGYTDVMIIDNESGMLLLGFSAGLKHPEKDDNWEVISYKIDDEILIIKV